MRASSVSKCMRERIFGSAPRDPLKEPFLEDGFWLQQSVIGFLVNHCDLKFNEDLDYYADSLFPELPGSYDMGDYGILTGSCDGVVWIDGSPRIVEIKALSAKSFKRIAQKDNWDWAKFMPAYADQLQVYLNLRYLPVKPEVGYMVFKNRDTGEIVGGIPPTTPHPGYTYKESLRLERDPVKFGKIVAREKEIQDLWEKWQAGEVFEKDIRCDHRGYCFYCEKPGNRDPECRRVQLETTTSLVDLDMDIRYCNHQKMKTKKKLRAILKQYNADIVEFCLPSGDYAEISANSLI